jgi:hypothetical protein
MKPLPDGACHALGNAYKAAERGSRSLYTAPCDDPAAAAAAAAARLSRHTALWPAQLLRWHSALHQRSGPRQPAHCLSRALDPPAPQAVHSRDAGPGAAGPGPCSGGRRSISSASARASAQAPCCDPAAAASSASAAASAERPHACRARAFTAAAAWRDSASQPGTAGSAATCEGLGAGG